MDRLTQRLKACRKSGRKALVTFITAGDPDLSTTVQAMQTLEGAGADIIELGVPFSDPMADGPTIQLSSERALAAGTTLEAILETVSNFRQSSELPVILMGYLNPVHAYGYERFARDAVKSGVDGVLLVDLPPEEAGEFLPHARKAGLNVIFLLTPTSDDSRMAVVNRIGRGFIYYVTVTGVTGARQSVSGSLSDELARVRRCISLPVMAGFGISTPEQAREVAGLADGVVVGSAIVKLFEQHGGERLMQELSAFTGGLRRALD